MFKCQTWQLPATTQNANFLTQLMKQKTVHHDVDLEHFGTGGFLQTCSTEKQGKPGTYLMYKHI